MRVLGMDVRHTCPEVVSCGNGRCRSGGHVQLAATELNRFAEQLDLVDTLVIEAAGNSSVAARVLKPHFARLVIANPLLGRAIAHAEVKTDKVDAAMLAQLFASGFLPEVWTPDPVT